MRLKHILMIPLVALGLFQNTYSADRDTSTGHHKSTASAATAPMITPYKAFGTHAILGKDLYWEFSTKRFENTATLKATILKALDEGTAVDLMKEIRIHTPQSFFPVTERGLQAESAVLCCATTAFVGACGYYCFSGTLARLGFECCKSTADMIDYFQSSATSSYWEYIPGPWNEKDIGNARASCKCLTSTGSCASMVTAPILYGCCIDDRLCGPRSSLSILKRVKELMIFAAENAIWYKDQALISNLINPKSDEGCSCTNVITLGAEDLATAMTAFIGNPQGFSDAETLKHLKATFDNRDVKALIKRNPQPFIKKLSIMMAVRSAGADDASDISPYLRDTVAELKKIPQRGLGCFTGSKMASVESSTPLPIQAPSQQAMGWGADKDV